MRVHNNFKLKKLKIKERYLNQMKKSNQIKMWKQKVLKLLKHQFKHRLLKLNKKKLLQSKISQNNS